MGTVGSKEEQSVGKDAVASFIRKRAICGLGSLAFEGHGKKGVEYPAAILSSLVTEGWLQLLFSFSGGRLSAGTFPALGCLRALQVDITVL